MKSHFLPLRFRSILNSRIGFCINSIKFLTSKFLDCKTENTFKLFVHETFLVRKWREICLEFFFFQFWTVFQYFIQGQKEFYLSWTRFYSISFDCIRTQDKTQLKWTMKIKTTLTEERMAPRGREEQTHERNKTERENKTHNSSFSDANANTHAQRHCICFVFFLVMLRSNWFFCLRVFCVFYALDCIVFSMHSLFTFFRLSLSLSCCTILHSGRCRRQAIVSAFLISVFIRFLSVSLCLRAMESAWHAIVRQSRHREAAALTRKKRFLKRQKKKGKILNGVALRRPLELFNGNHILCSLRVLIHSCRLFHTFSPSIFLCDIVPSCFPWSLAEQTNCVVLTRLFIATFENWPLFQWRAVKEAKGNASRSVVFMFFFSVSRYQHETIADILTVVVRSLL